jgi:uncharacterized iron-regulated protein
MRPGGALVAVLLVAAAVAPARAQDCAGDVVRVEDGASLAFSEVLDQAAKAGTLILGERHGVEAHPQAAACLLALLPTPTTLVVEQIARDRQGVIATWRADHPETADGLGAALEWWRSGWPAWRVYRPLFAAAWRARVDVVAADKSADDDARLSVKLADLGARGERLVADWSEAMRVAQCGLPSPQEARKSGREQALRDIGFVETLGARDGPVLFYAGRSHARRDRSVPSLLAEAGRPALVVSLQETQADGQPVDRAKVLADARGRFDLVWFVGVSREGDACSRLRAKGLIP